MNKKKIGLIIILVFLVLISVGLLIYYKNNIRQTEVGNAHISPEGDAVAFERVFKDRKNKKIIYLVGIYDMKTGKTEYILQRKLPEVGEYFSVLGFGDNRNDLILSRSDSLVAKIPDLQNKKETIRLKWGRKGEIGERNEDIPDFLRNRDIKVSLKDHYINKPAKLVSLVKNKEVKGDNLPDRINFGKSLKVEFKEKPYYLILTQKPATGEFMSETSLSPIPITGEKVNIIIDVLGANPAVFYYNPEEKLVVRLFDYNDPLENLIYNMCVIPGKEAVLFTCDNKATLVNLSSPPKIIKEFPLKKGVPGKNLTGAYPFLKKSSVSSKKGDKIYLIDGKKIIGYNLENDNESIVHEVKDGILHNIDLSRDGGVLVLEWHDNKKNHICYLDLSSGQFKPIIEDEASFINPASIPE
ncbi:MAG: hypothetical protein K8T10_14935 [Candidatus Eremiobacteraeota bacterium]|nr:hypothetical protein [Candidatus Eremiobacteraeota bacterium]